ncbi:MAG: hypothetical protein UW69_C0086G0008 [Microgenomates group bacterium GW2011_GWA2_44_7]|nr:MAG: hypothetical protein UW69_C0086G0008 [Microgenomates group bacterium GW2011_GWA2_44_7]KKT78445.1 MAG: hypothetical protein UW73_C0003G0093 [Microgenomates group bacterium GW2011_GWB1_44_8]
MERKKNFVLLYIFGAATIIIIFFLVKNIFKSTIPVNKNVQTDTSAESLVREDDNQSQVTVTAKPVSWPDDSQRSTLFVFEILLNTHSVDLSTFDIKTSAELVDLNTGTAVKPTQWLEESGSTHHRDGQLIFPRFKGKVRNLKLVIRNLGGMATRQFKWEL